MTRFASRRSSRLGIVRESDGSLFDATNGRPISGAALRDHIGDGGFFEAHRRHGGAVCTSQVLREVVREGLVPGIGFGGWPAGLSRAHDPLDLLSRLVAVAEAWAGQASRREVPGLDPGGPPGLAGPAADGTREG